MKNHITQFSLVIITFVVLTFLMSYTRPAADEPKQYITVLVHGPFLSGSEKLALQVNQKISEGWRPQGGVATTGDGFLLQAMVK